MGELIGKVLGLRKLARSDTDYWDKACLVGSIAYMFVGELLVNANYAILRQKKSNGEEQR